MLFFPWFYFWMIGFWRYYFLLDGYPILKILKDSLGPLSLYVCERMYPHGIITHIPSILFILYSRSRSYTIKESLDHRPLCTSPGGWDSTVVFDFDESLHHDRLPPRDLTPPRRVPWKDLKDSMFTRVLTSRPGYFITEYKFFVN